MMEAKNMSLGYFPPYKQYYISGRNKGKIFYLSGGSIKEEGYGRPSYFNTEKAAMLALNKIRKERKCF